MSCKALKLKGCEIKGSTFQGRKFSFPNRDISNDAFTLKIHKINLEIIGLIKGNEVFFSYEALQSLKTGLNIIEFWAYFEGIGVELIAIEEFYISNDICSCESVNNTYFTLEFPEENINYLVEYSIINISVGSDTPLEIKTKYESNPDTNAFTDLEKTKLESLHNYDDSNNLKIVEVIIDSSTIFPLTIVNAIPDKLLFWINGVAYTDSFLPNLSLTFAYNDGDPIYIESTPTVKSTSVIINPAASLNIVRTLLNKYSNLGANEINYLSNKGKSIEIRSISSPLEIGKIIKLKVIYTNF